MAQNYLCGKKGLQINALLSATAWNLKKYIVTSQLPVADWYDAIGDPTVADAILVRIVHSAHMIELTGESVRKMKVGKNNYTKIKMTPSARIL